MKDKILDLFYTVKYTLLNTVDTVRFSAEDLFYSIKNKFDKPESFEIDEVVEKKPVKKKKKKTSKKKK